VLAAGVALFEAIELEFCWFVSYFSVGVCGSSRAGSGICAFDRVRGFVMFQGCGEGSSEGKGHSTGPAGVETYWLVACP
jgi:hypothetical protein